ncbi:patatin-like phospholipase domain-containing protein [Pedobacter metabolipauper]|uniref:Patatin-like phospholipase n=1 Tax=Pedobacter metabolipauper TaxID=425513 RepID=A0A4V3D1I8_9SPHI|nr:patatin-like phospholipase family protein [Pedobacter metabolipauper]TDQ11383.1 hypothetical protein ATK78_0501 [Pedobacter metabolipauper]
MFGSIIALFKKGHREIKLSFNRLSLRILALDLLSIAAKIGFVIIPAFLIGTILIWLPQGRDTLLLMVEKLADKNPFPLLFLLIGIVLWCVSSELGVRYAIYISDNSGKNLSEARVEWRKTVQKVLAAFFLLWPPVAVILGLIWSSFTATYMDKASSITCFSICILSILLLIVVLSNLYFYKTGSYGPGRYRKTILGERSLPNQEQRYLRKLYGIYEDYVYALPKESSFQQPYKQDLQHFTGNFKEATDDKINEFPQSEEVLTSFRRVPEEFELKEHNIKLKKGESYRWVYTIPSSYYQGLHRQIRILALTAFILFLVLCFIPASWSVFERIAAPALVCIAFFCYTGLYIGLLYLDKSFLKKWVVSVRFFMFIILLLSSVFNDDHPVRENTAAAPHRETVSNHFKKWFIRYKHTINSNKGIIHDSKQRYPVIFICAEGGALRTGAYTSIFLSSLEKKLAEHNIDLKGALFAMSGVSGGAVGLGVFNAVTYRSSYFQDPTARLEASRKFFKNDALSPIIGKMLYGDFIQLFIPWHFKGFDRAIGLEQSWEKSYETTGDPSNVFKTDFIDHELSEDAPLFMINTTEVETGLQCWLSNLKPDRLLFAKERDLFDQKINNLNYSTAINFSSRFPIFSPGGKIGRRLMGKHHYLDGGYVENTGSASMLEILQILKNDELYVQVDPIVINLLFGEESEKHAENIERERFEREPFEIERVKIDKDTYGKHKENSNINWFNEWSEILNGVLNTRSGRSHTSRALLKQLVNIDSGLFLDAPLQAKTGEVPMNWVLSNQSISKINEEVNLKLEQQSGTAILNRLTRKYFTSIQFISNRPQQRKQ